MEELAEWAWKDKVLNAINVRRQRIGRILKAGEIPTRDTWVTVVCEKIKNTDIGNDFSLEARKVIHYVEKQLKKRRQKYYIDVMGAASGLRIASINIKNLKAPSESRANS